MGNFLAIVIGIWFWMAVILSFYFWFKRTDRSMSPIERRTRALGHGLLWPYYLFKQVAPSRSETQKVQERQERASRILGDTVVAPHTTYPPSPTDIAQPGPTSPQQSGSSRIANPFDQR